MGMKNYQPVFLLFSSIILSAAAQLLMKAGLLAFQLSGLSIDNGLWFLLDGLLGQMQESQFLHDLYREYQFFQLNLF